MKQLQYLGLGLFLLAFAAFLSLPLIAGYQLRTGQTASLLENVPAEARPFLGPELAKLEGQAFPHKFAYYPALQAAVTAANAAMAEAYALDAATLAAAAAAAEQHVGADLTLDSAAHAAAIATLPEAMQSTLAGYTGWMVGRSYPTPEALREAIQGQFAAKGALFLGQRQIRDAGPLLSAAARSTGTGPFWARPGLFFWLIIVGGSLGGLLYSFPAFFDGMPGIKHNGIYFSSATNRGLIGILMGAFLIGFYILLYFFPAYITEWIVLADPVSQALRGEPASQWFMYGFLYTVVILVMGVRMLAKYRHSRYHQVRTWSVMFFQVAFAFLIPQVLYLFNLPEVDLKNAWPLNYYFFFDWNLQNHLNAGTLGLFMLGWGLALTAIGVPVLTYFYGKRWYCSWVCGCGALAETLGDPYRQLSDKSLRAWQVERWLIHGVLLFAVVMTLAVLYTFLPPAGEGGWINRTTLVILTGTVIVGLGLALWSHERQHRSLGRPVFFTIIGTGAALLGIMTWNHTVSGGQHLFFFDSYQVRSLYGFLIGSIFAGVVGTGFYPLMGNRVWCRFGCPLAAYLGLVQRFKSRFRITTNGGQCISCGNCSTYCEQGIDVRAYAQRGQNIVRSSCVGCGVCAAVCPRGVLALENGPDTGESRMK